MTFKRQLLVLLAATGLAFNALFFSMLHNPREEGDDKEIEAAWVAYMPELEDKQRLNPRNSLRGGVHGGRDPDYPDLIVYRSGEDWSPYSKLGAVAYRCGFTGFSIRTYVFGMDDTEVSDMPDRLFLAEETATAILCVQSKLPRGFVLARL